MDGLTAGNSVCIGSESSSTHREVRSWVARTVNDLDQ